MSRKPKKMNTSIIVVLYIIAAIFFIYGIYMVIYSVDYVRSYQSVVSVGMENSIQYIVTASAAYFAFAVIIFTGARILHAVAHIAYGEAASLPTVAEVAEDTEVAEEDISPASKPVSDDTVIDDTVILEEVIVEKPEPIEKSEPVINEEPEKISSSMIKNIFEGK